MGVSSAHEGLSIMKGLIKSCGLFWILSGLNSTSALSENRKVVVQFLESDGAACENVNSDSLNIVYDNDGVPAISFYLSELSIKLPALNEDDSPASKQSKFCYVNLNFKVSEDTLISAINAELELKGTIGISSNVKANASAYVDFFANGGDRLLYGEYVGSANWIGPKQEPFYLRNSRLIELENTNIAASNEFDVTIRVRVAMEADLEANPRSAGILRIKTGDIRPKIEFKVKLSEQ